MSSTELITILETPRVSEIVLFIGCVVAGSRLIEPPILTGDVLAEGIVAQKASSISLL